MDNDGFSVPVDMFVRNNNNNSVAMDGIESQVTASSLFLLDSFNHNGQNQTFGGYAFLPSLQAEPVTDLHSAILTANRFVDDVEVEPDAPSTSVVRNLAKDDSFGNSSDVANGGFHEQFVGGAASMSDASLANLLAARSDLHENLNSFGISGPSFYPLEPIRTYVSNNCSDAMNSSFASTLSHDRVEVFGNVNGKGNFQRYLLSDDLDGRNTIRPGFQPYSYMETHSWLSSQGVNISNNSTDSLHGCGKFSNELSLSLATAHPSAINGTNISDQCSEISCSGLRQHCLKASRLRSEQTSSSSKELSLSCGSNRAGQFSQVISTSKYLNVMQEILAQIASYSVENLDPRSSYTSGLKSGASMLFPSSDPTEMRMMLTGCDESPNGNSKVDVLMDPALQKRALEAKKAQLLTLLQMVDEQYNQCLDEIHTVISAFHAATELDPQIHTRFALQTISFLYKNLRERISSQILSIGAHFDEGSVRGSQGSFDTSYFQKQWTLQQLKKKEQQLWRPQRGLPERSVAVLRAWMFQNFLHPYPKDAEKHLLAVKSGLTRSQVSNWFINARVRLWKPMIEEMYTEMNKRKGRQNEEGTNSNYRSQISIISNQRFKVN